MLAWHQMKREDISHSANVTFTTPCAEHCNVTSQSHASWCRFFTRSVGVYDTVLSALVFLTTASFQQGLSGSMCFHVVCRGLTRLPSQTDRAAEPHKCFLNAMFLKLLIPRGWVSWEKKLFSLRFSFVLTDFSVTQPSIPLEVLPGSGGRSTWFHYLSKTLSKNVYHNFL